MTSGWYWPRAPARPRSCAFAMAEATALFTRLRRRRTLGDITTNQSLRLAASVVETTMNLPADARRKKKQGAELARLAGPQELVGLDTPQHVELAGAFVDRRANGQGHQHQSDAVLLELLVEAVLIEIERAVVEKAVHHGGGGAVEAQHEHPQPAAIEGTPGELVVKRAHVVRPERGPALVEPAIVILEELGERLAALRVARDALEAHVELLVERADAPPNVRAMRRAERRQVGIPGVPYERNVRTGSAGRCRPRPAARVQAVGTEVGHGRGSKMRETKRRALRSDELFDRGESFGFPAAADDHVEIVRAHVAGCQHVETGKVRGAGRRTERRHRNQLGARADGDHPQARGSAQVRPPRMQPLPGEERRRGGAGAQEGAPFGTQRRKAPRGVDEQTVDVGCLFDVQPAVLPPFRDAGGDHAASLATRGRCDPPKRRFTCRATCVM